MVLILYDKWFKIYRIPNIVPFFCNSINNVQIDISYRLLNLIIEVQVLTDGTARVVQVLCPSIDRKMINDFQLHCPQ